MESKERRDIWEGKAVGTHRCFVEAKAENHGLLSSVQLVRGLLVPPAEIRSTEGPDLAGRFTDLV